MFATRSSNVEVAIRARPLRPEEGSLGWDIESATLTERQNPDSSFNFDKVYDMSKTNKDIYIGSVKNSIVSQVANGYNGTVFMYGQTGAGKSWSMMGSGLHETTGNVGIAQYALRDLFDLLEKVEKPKGYRIRVFLEMIEIYNENLRDLLSKDSDANANLKIAEGEYGVYVRGAIRRQVTSFDDCLGAMAHEAAERVVAATNMNHQSSRSHCLIRITVEKVMTVAAADTKSKDEEENDESAVGSTTGDESAGGTSSSSRSMERKVVSSLNLVDLAGSERVSKTGATGQRLIEGGRINQSLSCLTNVIMKMSEQRKPGQTWHIPFRDSKLTHLLKTAIGGNSFTTVCCCMTPSESQVDESRSTLQFAQRAKKIRNEVQVNEVADPRTRIRTLELEIKKMRRMMVATDLYLWSKQLRLKHLMESGGGGAAHQQQQQANEELTQGLVEENQALRAELQDALEAIAAMGGGNSSSNNNNNNNATSTSVHVDPVTGVVTKSVADPQEVEDLKNKIFLLESELEEVMGVKGNLQVQCADLEDMLDELEAESQTTQKAKDEQISQLRDQVRAYETEKQQLAAETESLRSQVEQMTAAREEEQQQLIVNAQGDEAREQLAQLHVKHQTLQFEHNTLFEMYSKAEVEKAAKENALQELLQDAETRCAAVKSEVSTIQSYVWKFVNLANQVVNGNLHASGEGAEVNVDNARESGNIRQQQVDHAYRVLNDCALRRGGSGGGGGGGFALAALHHDQGENDFVKGFRRTATTADGGEGGGGSSNNNVEALQRRVKELESIITQKDNSRDVIIDTKLKRMQELVLRLHTSNTHMQLEVDRVVAENKRLHQLVARDGKLSAIVKSDGLQPASADLIKTAAQFGSTPHQPYNHN